jgi:hypothetical protein
MGYIFMPFSNYQRERVGSVTIGPTRNLEAGSLEEITITFMAGDFGIRPSEAGSALGSTLFEATFTFTVVTARQLVVSPRETLA